MTSSWRIPEAHRAAEAMCGQSFSKSNACSCRIWAAVDEGELGVFGERLHELGRSSRAGRSRRLQMRQDLSNDFIVGNERDHAELASVMLSSTLRW